jgi:hypothetical protein
MIIVKLIGGLGNQMFQYAAGRQLAKIKNVVLKLDKSDLGITKEGITYREVEIDLLNAKIDWASNEDLNRFQLSKFRGIRVLQRKFPSLFKKAYVTEAGHRYIKEFYNFPKDSYLNGYWQSELYFRNIRKELLQEFIPKNKLSQKNEEVLSRIKTVNSVSIHFRRGDYLSNANAAKFHGVMSLDYYLNAVQIINSKLVNPEFFVFSDEPEWVKENFKLDFPVHYIDFNKGKEAVFDLALMSNCKHNIIANSSFSWWGAWLNNNSEKMVIAPKKWFSDASADCKDIVPEDWITI